MSDLDLDIDVDKDPPDDEVKEVMENQDLDRDTAERVVEIMDEYGVDEDDAVELEGAGL